MADFKMIAFARYPDGSSGDAFAEVSARTLVACFGAMAAEVADWLPATLAHGEGERRPQAIELTLEWNGAPAQAAVPDGPEAPSDPTRCNGHSPSRALRCAARRPLGCSAPMALPLQIAVRGELLGADA